MSSHSNTAPDRQAQELLIGSNRNPVFLRLDKLNRHGLISGATGTGKTISLRVMVEGFSRHGIPVFLADVKGDLSGLAMPGEEREDFKKRAAQLGVAHYMPMGYATVFWDLYGEQGHPIRASIQSMSATLLASMMELNDIQEGVLNIALAVAEQDRLPVVDLKDLRSLLNHVGERAAELRERYGNISITTIGAIQRQLLVLERQGAERFFGEPELDLSDLMQCSRQGEGQVNILAADRLLRESPHLYAVFLLWLLSRLFEDLPEVGDLSQPKLLFFFDEAHLLFDQASPSLMKRVEQVVRLIRSKGVGIFFVTQNPADIPDDVLGQLGNRVQHALRAFTEKDRKAVRAAAQTFRANPRLNTEDAIMSLGVGEALVSMLDEQGIPGVVEQVQMIPPTSRLQPLDPQQRRALMEQSPVRGRYDRTVDRESAHEMLQASKSVSWTDALTGQGGKNDSGKGRGRGDSWATMIIKQTVRSMTSRLATRLTKVLWDALLKK